MAALRALIGEEAPEAEVVRTAITELQTATMKIGEALNKQAPGDDGDKDKAEDAEYADKKDEEKK